MKRFEGLILLSGLYKISGLLLFFGSIVVIFVPAIKVQVTPVLIYILIGCSLYGLGLLINVLLSIEESLRSMANFFKQRSKPKPE